MKTVATDMDARGAIEKYLRDNPGAGRPAIARDTGLPESRVRAILSVIQAEKQYAGQQLARGDVPQGIAALDARSLKLPDDASDEEIAKVGRWIAERAESVNWWKGAFLCEVARIRPMKTAHDAQGRFVSTAENERVKALIETLGWEPRTCRDCVAVYEAFGTVGTRVPTVNFSHCREALKECDTVEEARKWVAWAGKEVREGRGCSVRALVAEIRANKGGGDDPGGGDPVVPVASLAGVLKLGRECLRVRVETLDMGSRDRLRESLLPAVELWRRLGGDDGGSAGD